MPRSDAHWCADLAGKSRHQLVLSLDDDRGRETICVRPDNTVRFAAFSAATDISA